MVNVSAMRKAEAKAYLEKEFGEEADPDWTALDIKERIQQC